LKAIIKSKAVKIRVLFIKLDLNKSLNSEWRDIVILESIIDNGLLENHRFLWVSMNMVISPSQFNWAGKEVQGSNLENKLVIMFI